jgi:hypothetical protein
MPSSYIPEGESGIKDESFFDYYLNKKKNKLEDLGRGSIGMNPREGGEDSFQYKGGQVLNALGSNIPGISAITGAGQLYEKNKERVPNIIGNLASKFAPSESDKQLGVKTDPVVAALQKLQDPSRDFSSDLRSTASDAGNYLSRAVMGTMSGVGQGSRQEPGEQPTMNAMTILSLADRKDAELASKMNSGKLPVSTRQSIARIAQNNFNNLDDVEKGQLLRSLDLSDESSLRNYLGDLTQGKKGAGTDKITRPLLGALVPDDALGIAGMSGSGKAGQHGYTNFSPSPTSGNTMGFKDYLQRFKRLRGK